MTVDVRRDGADLPNVEKPATAQHLHFIFEVFEGADAPRTHWDAVKSAPV